MIAVASKPLVVRCLHWSTAALIGTAFLTGFIAFDFDLELRIITRDALFAVHRLCGIAAALTLLIWTLYQICGLRHFQLPSLRGGMIATFHAAVVGLSFCIPIMAWIARSLDGRTTEFFSLLPQANLVSHPNNPQTYQLLALHKQLGDILLVLLAVHIVAAAFHHLYLRDGTLRSMLWAGRKIESSS